MKFARMFLMVAVLCIASGCKGIADPSNLEMIDRNPVIQAKTLKQTALSIYRVQQLNAVFSGKTNGKSDSEIKQNLDAIRGKWLPVWGMFDEMDGLLKELSATVKEYYRVKEEGGMPDIDLVVSLIQRISVVQLKINELLDSLNPG